MEVRYLAETIEGDPNRFCIRKDTILQQKPRGESSSKLILICLLNQALAMTEEALLLHQVAVRILQWTQPAENYRLIHGIIRAFGICSDHRKFPKHTQIYG